MRVMKLLAFENKNEGRKGVYLYPFQKGYSMMFLWGGCSRFCTLLVWVAPGSWPQKMEGDPSPGAMVCRAAAGPGDSNLVENKQLPILLVGPGEFISRLKRVGKL